MKLYKDLLQRAGLVSKMGQITATVFGATFIVYALAFAWTKITGFALSLALLTMLFCLEALRLFGNGRQERLLKSYPALFDSMAQSLSSGTSIEQQIQQLSKAGPIELRREFNKVALRLESGESVASAIDSFRTSAANRFADIYCEVVLISLESGLSGQRENWRVIASRTRAEQGTTSLVLAKQDWVLGSAKVALLSPWLIAALLIQLPQNKEVFATEAGSAVLVVGLALSVFAYFLVNKLGTLKAQPRIFA